jgi:hypothetical protein
MAYEGKVPFKVQTKTEAEIALDSSILATEGMLTLTDWISRLGNI